MCEHGLEVGGVHRKIRRDVRQCGKWRDSLRWQLAIGSTRGCRDNCSRCRRGRGSSCRSWARNVVIGRAPSSGFQEIGGGANGEGRFVIRALGRRSGWWGRRRSSIRRRRRKLLLLQRVASERGRRRGRRGRRECEWGRGRGRRKIGWTWRRRKIGCGSSRRGGCNGDGSGTRGRPSCGRRRGSLFRAVQVVLKPNVAARAHQTKTVRTQILPVPWTEQGLGDIRQVLLSEWTRIANVCITPSTVMPPLTHHPFALSTCTLGRRPRHRTTRVCFFLRLGRPGKPLLKIGRAHV